jgi:predicted CopG family antitoxin
MSKTIKLEDSVYLRLEGFRGKRETFSQAVDRLLKMLSKVGELRDVLEGAVAFEKGRQERLEKLVPKEE